MTIKQALGALKKAGTAQNRKVYGHHGVTCAMFGVSFAELKKLKKQIGVDHELARQLWASGNHDARILACMTADAQAMTSGEIDTWSRQLDSYVLLRYRDAIGRPYLRDFGLEEVDEEIRRNYHNSPAFVRLVADHIAGMTDKYALDEYERLYSPYPRELGRR